MPKAIRWSNQLHMYHFQAYSHTLEERNQHQYIDDENDILIGITPS